jgi:hypothetical protein
LENLNELRNNVSDFRKQKKTEIKSIMQNSGLTQSEKQNKIIESRKSIRKYMKDIGTKLKPIAENNIDLLKKIGETAKPFAEKWKTEINKLIDNWKIKNKNLIENKAKSLQGNDREFASNGFGKFRDNNDKERGKKFIAKVMLYNGEINYDDEDLFDHEMLGALNQSITETLNIKVSPNPFSDKTKISFILNKASNVKLNITDEKGNKLTDIFNGSLSKGIQEFEFKPIQDNSNGIYFYNLEIDGKVSSGKIIYNK